MATTRATIKRNAMVLLRQNQPSIQDVDDALLNLTIAQWIDQLALEGPIGQAWNTAWVTLAAGTANYTVATEYAAILDVVLASQGRSLKIVGPSALEALREGDGTSSGDPTHCALIESTAQAVQVRLFPEPHKTDTLDALLKVMPTAPADDASTIAVGKGLARALEWFVAADIAGASANPAWRPNAERALMLEKMRLGAFTAGTGFMPSML